MGRRIRRVFRRAGRAVRDVVDVATGGLTNTGKSEEAKLLEEQQRAQEQALREQEEARKREEIRKQEEADYMKKVQAQKDKISQEQQTQQQIAENAGQGGLDASNVGLGDVKVDFGKLLSKEEDEDTLKKALRK